MRVRMKRTCNNHLQRRNVPHPSNENRVRSIDGTAAIVLTKMFWFTFAKNWMS